jgi:hypothetical protein
MPFFIKQSTNPRILFVKNLLPQKFQIILSLIRLRKQENSFNFFQITKKIETDYLLDFFYQHTNHQINVLLAVTN